MMKLNISWRYVVAFLALNMIMGELHEQAHISTGYFICGCYGPRDISSWQTCSDCTNPSWAFIATAIGPLFSYAMIWLGATWFTKSVNIKKRSFGFALLFANLPFARIFTALVGGGDEKVFIHHMLGEDTAMLLARMLAIIITILICWPPVVLVAKNLANRYKYWIIAAFLILPLLFGIIYQRMLINQLLKQGIGSEAWILGTPNLILIHIALMITLLIMFRKEFRNCFSMK